MVYTKQGPIHTVNTRRWLFCFFKLFLMVSKGLRYVCNIVVQALIQCVLFCRVYGTSFSYIPFSLIHEGVPVTTPDGPTVCRAMVLQASVDLPARALVFNMKQFNGKYACIYCIDEGCSHSDSPLHRWWPYKPGVLCRSHNAVIRSARKALESSDAVSIVEWVSPRDVTVEKLCGHNLYIVYLSYCSLVSLTGSISSCPCFANIWLYWSLPGLPAHLKTGIHVLKIRVLMIDFCGDLCESAASISAPAGLSLQRC